MVSVVPPTGELEGYGWVGAAPSRCSVVNRDMSVPSRYFWTARTVRPAWMGGGLKTKKHEKKKFYLKNVLYQNDEYSYGLHLE